MIDLNLLPIAKGGCKRQTCDKPTLGSGNYPFEGDCLFFLGGAFSFLSFSFLNFFLFLSFLLNYEYFYI